MPPHNASSWKALVDTLIPDGEFAGPAREDRIATVEAAFGITLPESLRTFLGESDGLVADYGSGVIWSASDIVARNHKFRTSEAFRALYMPFSALLFFADDGGGNQFAFAIHADGQIHKSVVYCWDHESDSRSWFAAHLEQYLAKRLKAGDDD